MKNLKTFENPDFGKLTVVEKNGEPWFVGKDVAEALGYSNVRDALRKHVDAEDKGVAECDTPGGTQNMTVINESGVYSLAFGSKLPSAKKFKHWVTSEVLPSVRKYGAYMTAETLEKAIASPDFLIHLATELKAEKTARLAAEQQIEQDKPKVLFADAVSASHTSILVGELAKILRGNGIEIGQKRLFSWLRGKGYLIKRKGTDYNMPTQRAMEMGLFEIKEGSYINGNGANIITKTPKVTGRGQNFFINKFLKQEEANERLGDFPGESATRA